MQFFLFERIAFRKPERDELFILSCSFDDVYARDAESLPRLIEASGESSSSTDFYSLMAHKGKLIQLAGIGHIGIEGNGSNAKGPRVILRMVKRIQHVTAALDPGLTLL